jgi:hypothetical protein
MKRILIPLFLLLPAPAAWAQSAAWQKSWDATLAAARKEGKVVVAGPPRAFRSPASTISTSMIILSP